MNDTVLIVDDEEGIRRVLGMSLGESGYRVLTAARGHDAMEMVRNEHPQVVLADIKMPGMDGIELLQRIREEDPDIEVIMMTGHADLDLAIKSLQYEAADFITKPINFDALQVALKRVQEKIWMREQLRQYTEGLERMVSEKSRKLVEAEKLAAVGQTVATLAHAVKNIIGGLNGGIFMVEKGLESDDRKYLSQGWGMVKGNVGKIKHLVLDLLNYSKERQPDYDLCDPNIPAREVYHLMLPRAREHGVVLELDLAEDFDKVCLDVEGIFTCLLNLVTNAIDACADPPPGRSCRVVVRSRKVDDWAVEYQVEDNGHGMDEKAKKKAFSSFFSTKGTKGTGLGLMITEKIVREHGGSIELDSQAGAGATFTIRLPKRDAAVVGIAPAPPEPETEDF